MELLAPTGDFEQLEAALAFGADAAYLATKELGMRTGPANFSPEGLAAAAQTVHRKDTWVHMTCNTLPHTDELDHLPDLPCYAQRVGMDALIITDLGMMKLVQKYAPNVKLHVFTQAGVVDHETAHVFYGVDASYVVLVKKLSMDEIVQIRTKTPPELELEVFVHGSMCVSFSGRCLLSNYLTGRDANRGDCARPCRWSYRLVEEKRLGEYLPIEEDDRGICILNSRDMCMTHHIPELQKAGISSLKTKGRAKSVYYVTVAVDVYRSAIDFYEQHPGEPLPKRVLKELNKTSHREHSTGFYFGTSGQVYQDDGYVRDHEVAAVCEGRENDTMTLLQRNHFFRGDTVDVLESGAQFYLLMLDELYDAEITSIDTALHATVQVPTRTEHPVKSGALLRRMRDE